MTCTACASGREFARAEGSLSKNDAIDAALISRFADKIGVRVLEPQEVEAVELKRKFRQTMMDSRTAMINRLETEIDPEMKALLKEQIKHMDKVIDKAERLCLETVEKDVRNALYMDSLASIQWNLILGTYYRKKRAEGHPHAKTQGRRNLADLPFTEKVKCVIELQRRLQPIYARRGIYIKHRKS